ncbi:MAG: response regulator [Oscillospiraceae bacterium]|jgi:YesN/AraC family two-component response regulator|nr:response regulator [Oscillospiraceae bacterium]
MWKAAIVDDERATREGLLCHVPWRALGIEQVRAVADAPQMLSLCREMRPDIVISDIRMPGMDGIALCQTLRKSLPKCRIIFLSGYSDKAYLKAAIELSAVSYVEKPVSIAELTRVLARAVAECEQLSGWRQDAHSAALAAQYAEALHRGDRQGVLAAAQRVREALVAASPDVSALHGTYFQLCYQTERRGWMPQDEASAIEALRAALDALPDLDALHGALTERIETAFPTGAQGMPLNPKVQDALRYMQGALSDPALDLTAIARQVYTSPTYLASLFKKEMGDTVRQYLSAMRMRHACGLLRERTLKLYQVAQRCGYTDANYFTKAFRKAMGMTPKAYREKMM